MRRSILAAVLFLAAPVLPGCLLVAGAAVGAGVVYAAGEDSSEVRVEADAARAYSAAREEVILRGTLQTSDAAGGTLTARIGTSDVTVKVVGEPTENRTRVTVTARANAGISPDRDTAERVAVAIVKRLQ